MSLDDTAGWVQLVSQKADFAHKYILSDAVEEYRGKPWPLINHIEAFSIEKDVPMLISTAKMKVMRGVLAGMNPKPKMILEFGTYIGSSTVAWGQILKELNESGESDLRVYGFEMDPKIADVARDLVKLAGVADIVTILDGPGSDSLKKLHAEGKVAEGQVDMVFIDHWEKYYVPDLQLCEQLKVFHVGSLACADNTDYPGAPTYVKYVKGGGSGLPGAVRYESESVVVRNEPDKDMSIVEVSKVVEI